jgi:hypothetical protein
MTTARQHPDGGSGSAGTPDGMLGQGADATAASAAGHSPADDDGMPSTAGTTAAIGLLGQVDNHLAHAALRLSRLRPHLDKQPQRGIIDDAAAELDEAMTQIRRCTLDWRTGPGPDDGTVRARAFYGV